jgi:hypothetical protein
MQQLKPLALKAGVFDFKLSGNVTRLGKHATPTTMPIDELLDVPLARDDLIELYTEDVSSEEIMGFREASNDCPFFENNAGMNQPDCYVVRQRSESF